MKLRALVIGAATAVFLAIPGIAMAAWGQVTGNVNLRTGPSGQYNRITTLPAGARVWVNGAAGNGWLSVRYGNWTGFVSGNYIAYASVRPRIYRPPPPPPTGYWHRPWWDDRYHTWYDGRRWYRNGVWFSNPGGLYFGFSFGR